MEFFFHIAKVLEGFKSGTQKDSHMASLHRVQHGEQSHCAISSEAQPTAASPHVSLQFLNCKCKSSVILINN